MRMKWFYDKYLVSCLMIFSVLPTLARAESTGSPSEQILAAIDNICGDIWCEGDFDFQFQRVILNSATDELQLFFKMSQDNPTAVIQNSDGNFQAQVNHRSYDVSCIIPGYSFVEKIMTPEKVLQHEFYLVLTSCIGALENKIYLNDKFFP